MAPTITAILTFIPTNVWVPLKKFMKSDSTIVSDVPFKLSTKYTPALLIVMMCGSFANQFFRNVDMDCVSIDSKRGGGDNYGANKVDVELNDYCWNSETFLVARALEPRMQGLVPYPGMTGHGEGDQLIRQRYYKYVWLLLVKLAVLAFLPQFFWKVRGTKKIKSLVELGDVDETVVTEEEVRVTYFIETLGFNSSFAYHYLGCKILATFTPYFQWYYICGFIGPLYKYYGVEVIQNFMGETEPWPNPMDVLFPKMAKCDWKRFGFGGSIEIRSAQCQLPLNNMSQWSFFLFWWWLALILIINIFSLLHILIAFFPPTRSCYFRHLVSRTSREDLEKARTYSVIAGGVLVKRKKSRWSAIKVGLSFGDWFVLHLVKKNLADWKFRNFIRKLVMTKNVGLQFNQCKAICQDVEGQTQEQKVKWFQKLGNEAQPCNSKGMALEEAALSLPPPPFHEIDNSTCDYNLTIAQPVPIDRQAKAQDAKTNSNNTTGNSGKKAKGKSFNTSTPYKATAPPMTNDNFDEEEW